MPDITERHYTNFPVFVADTLGLDIPDGLDGPGRQRWAEAHMVDLPPFRFEGGFYWVDATR